MRLQKEKWSFRSLEEVHQAANTVLKFAMFNERSKRWPKVAESYKRLLWLVDKTHFPKDFEPPASYAVLMYELHYHLGVALQRLDQHRKALTQFTKAIESVSIPKGGCLAGCVANSCLMTPILARRAFAYAKVGNMKSALRDAENSVVLDNLNPDVYCIRALVRGSRNEETLAAQDVDAGLKLNPSHVCALIIRGALCRTLAEKLNPESQTFYTVTNFNHPCLLDFYDRFLFTLSVPHTITEINLTPDKPSKKQLESNPELFLRAPARIGSAHSSSGGAGDQPEASSLSQASRAREATEPFRCGTPACSENKSAARRRRDYGEAVRKFMARPKTAKEFLTQLEKERTKRSVAESQRATSELYDLAARTDPPRRVSSAGYPSSRSQQSADHVTSLPASSQKSSVTSPVKDDVPVAPSFVAFSRRKSSAVSRAETIAAFSRQSSTMSGTDPAEARPSFSAFSRKSLVTSPIVETSVSPALLSYAEHTQPGGERSPVDGQSGQSAALPAFQSFKPNVRLDLETQSNVVLDLETKSNVRLDLGTKTLSGRTTKTSATKTFTFDTPSNYSIPVFQPMNIEDAPRMYYRPWRGDKLPIADVPHPHSKPAFY